MRCLTAASLGVVWILMAHLALAQPAPVVPEGASPAPQGTGTPAPKAVTTPATPAGTKPQPAASGTPAPVGTSEFVAPAATQVVPAASSQPVLTRGDYQARMRQMEERIVGLKESIYGTKTRLALLKERILANVVSEAWVIVVHKNEMGGSFTLQQVNYLVDGGAQQFFRENKDGFLDKQRQIQVFSGALAPGNHTLTVELVYRGSSGLFTYVEGYRFQIKANFDFSAVQGKILYIESIGYEKGGITTSMEERPAIQFKSKEHPFNRDTLNKLTGQKGDAE